eukprot:207655_1
MGRASKKSKKRQWRKIDLHEVENDIEKKRDAKHTASKSKATLFFVDTDGQALQKFEKKQKLKKLCGLKSVASDSVVQISKKIRKRKRTNDSQTSQKKKKKKADKIADIWGADKDSDKVVESATLGNFSMVVAPPKAKTFRHKNRKHAQSGIVKAPTKVCHPGASCNPSKKDHKFALHAAYEHHEETIGPEREAREKLNAIWKSVAEKDAEKRENGEDNYDPANFSGFDTDSSDDEQESEQNPAAPRAPVTVARISRPKRNRARRRRVHELAKIAKDGLKRHRRELDRVPEISKDVVEEKESIEKRLDEKQRSMAEAKPKTAKLGREKFQEAFPEVLPTCELSTSMRTMKTVNSALRDLQSEFQRRNIIETRKRKVMKRTLKVKHYTRSQDSMWGGNWKENNKQRQFISRLANKK